MLHIFKTLFLLTFTTFISIGQESILPPPNVTLPKIARSYTYKEYFFDDKLIVNDSTALVILIQEPQTQMAKELGHRIYKDTTFIRKIKNQFYEEKLVEDGKTKEVMNFCGYDMYFYSLYKNELTYLNKLNSNCGISEVSCKDLSILFESGKILSVDTLTSLPKKFNKSKATLFSDKVITSYFENTQQWDICKTSRFPNIYYDGYFGAEITLDSSFTINQNIELFLKKYTSEIQNINWNVRSNNIEVIKFIRFKESTKIELTVFLTKQSFKPFKSFDIQPIIPRGLKTGRELIIIHDE